MYKEKWALITGASGGIGSAISIQLAKEGYYLFLHYHRGDAAILRVKEACESTGSKVILLKADLAQVQEIERMVHVLRPMPEVLINNAGTTHYGLFSETQSDDIDRLYRINVQAPFLLSQRLVPNMIRNQRGRIVNISSIWGMTGASCEVLYSTTKGALLSFTKALAKELAPSRVTVNAVVPGAVQGDLMNRQFTQEDIDIIASEIPMGRLGKPEEIASMVSYLLKPEAEYITGQVISPNGGWYT